MALLVIIFSLTKVMYKFLDNKNYYMISNQYAYPASSIQLAKDILKLIPIILLNKYNKKYFGYLLRAISEKNFKVHVCKKAIKIYNQKCQFSK